VIKPVIYTRIPASDPKLLAAAAEAGVADLHEALGAVTGRMLLMDPRMRPLDIKMRVAGPAVTAFNYPGDNLMMHQALYLAEKGQVLVMANGGGHQGALWGELAGHYAQHKGVAGLVADAAVRDSAQLVEIGFPTWSSAIHASHPEKRGPGAVNVPVVVGGVIVNPGDIVVGDADGVLVIPPEHLAHAVAGAQERKAKEDGVRAKLAAGATLYEILGIEKSIAATGAEVRDTTWQQDQASRLAKS
jgi:4-hydroxy-4-methyl-2-oxoglutarate aldolase